MSNFLTTDDAPWNLLMAVSVVDSLPPVCLYDPVRRYLTGGARAAGRGHRAPRRRRSTGLPPSRCSSMIASTSSVVRTVYQIPAG